MAYTRPDVYVEEILTKELSPQGVSTSVAAFVGACERGPANKPILIDSFDAFQRTFGGALEKESLFFSVRSFFQNGGSSAFIVRLVSKSATTGSTPSAVAANHTFNHEGSSSVLKFSSGFRGDFSLGPAGKDFQVKLEETSKFVTQFDTGVPTSGDLSADAVGTDTQLRVKTLSGLSVGDLLKVENAGASQSAYVKIESTESKIVTGVVQHFINLSANVGSAITAHGSKISVLAYNLYVCDKVGNELERFLNLTLNPDSDDYFETAINDDQIGSRYVKVEDLNSSFLLNNTLEIEETVLGNKYALADDGQDELLNFSLADDLIGDIELKTGLQALTSKDDVNLLCVPPSLDISGGIFPESDIPKVHAAMLDYCGSRLDMFAILDAPAGLTASDQGDGSVGQYRSNDLGVDSYWGALYYPQIKVIKFAGKRAQINIPPSGAVAGLYSRVDQIGPPNGGISSSPAGYGELGCIKGIVGLEIEVSEVKHGLLNDLGVNCIRIVDRAVGLNAGALVLGARTLSSTLDFRYINVRRIMTFIEKSVKSIGKPYLFRNNSPRLWAELTSNIESFLRSRLEAGELAGNSPEEAFFVRIDATTNTAENIKQGILVGEIGLALLRPAEFIIFRFSQIQAGQE